LLQLGTIIKGRDLKIRETIESILRERYLV